MKVYVMARYSRKDEVAEVVELLKEAGLEVVSQWHTEPYTKDVQMRDLDHSIHRELAVRDLKELDEADAILALTESPDTAHVRGGRHTEFGYALAKGKKAVVCGPEENIFYTLPGVVVCVSLTQAINELLQSTPTRHPTEVSAPVQCAEFKSIIEGMYRLHLDKNQDYSPMNILATGFIGVVTRLWDKMARLMNLTGFDIRRGTLNVAKEPKNESIDDTLLDMANYAVIALILKRGKWGK